MLDERDARHTAQKLGLPVLGTVGVLIWAKRAGLIPTLRGQLEVLENKGGFRLCQAVVQMALAAVGESS